MFCNYIVYNENKKKKKKEIKFLYMCLIKTSSNIQRALSI